jgi:hypothetical protein
MGLFLDIPEFLVLPVLLIPLSATWVLLSLGSIWYQKYSRRARVLQFASESWVDVVAFIKDRITVYKANIFDQ